MAEPTTPSVFSSPLHDERNAAILGIALGVAFTTCFVTGVLSHLIQEPPSWFTWPSRPVGLYRVTQGLHVITGLASIPLLLAKLWVVFPKLFAWPPFTSVAHAIERLALIPLIAGGLFELFTGLANINLWYPWPFNFRTAHYLVAWITIGALIVHVGAKWATTRAAISTPKAAAAPRRSTPPSRRWPRSPRVPVHGVRRRGSHHAVHRGPDHRSAAKARAARTAPTRTRVRRGSRSTARLHRPVSPGQRRIPSTGCA